MRKALSLLALSLLCCVSLLAQNTNIGGSGGASTSAGVGLGYVDIVRTTASGLLADYQANVGDTVASLKDYSGNGNNATGTVGTAPTIAATTGGLVCAGTGAVSLPTALNKSLTLMLLVNFQSTTGVSSSFPVVSTGFGGSTAAIGIVFRQGSLATPQQGTFSFYGETYNTSTGAQFTALPISSLNGIFSVGMSMQSGADHMYLNGVDQTSNYYGTGTPTGATVEATGITGNYQLCGSTYAGGYWVGTIVRALFYSAALNSSQMTQNYLAMSSLASSNGNPPSLGSTDTTNTLTLLGDSETTNNGNLIPNNLFLSKTYKVSNVSNSGFTMASQEVPFASFDECPIVRAAGEYNIAEQWAGTNDVNAGTTLPVLMGLVKKWSAAEKNCGILRVVVTTPLDRTGNSAAEEAYAQGIRQGWRQMGSVDAIADMNADPVLGCSGCNSNATYFADGVHLTQQAQYNNALPIIDEAINGVDGNQDFSSANTYTSACTGAVTLTSGASESTNTMTFTASGGWTAACFTPGTRMHCTGISVAGYNDAYPGWMILTNTGTTITAYNGTTGLGTSTAAGTCISTQMQDVDVYVVLNGATPYTIQSCLGRTGQNLYIKNINGSSATIDAWAAGTGPTQEQIDGASTATVTTGSTLVLQSILTSSTAGGCSWKRIQNN